MRTILALLISFAAFIQSASADQAIKFIRITCLPDKGYFALEQKPIDSSKVFWGPYSGVEGQKKALAQWKEKGLFEGSFSYSCRMPQGVYSVKVTQAEFSERRCGADPQVRLSLSTDSSVVIYDAVFGTDCWSRNSISSIEITEGQPGWSSTDLNMCFNKNGSTLSQSCTLISADGYGKLEVKKPIEQSTVDDYFKDHDR